MKKRVDKLSKAAHIKRNTVGTSNELSFNVLEALKNELDGDSNASAPLKSVPLFTLPGKRKPARTPAKKEALALSSQAGHARASSSRKDARRTRGDEVSRRKSSRRRRKALVVAVCAAVCIAAVGAAGHFVYANHVAQQEYKERLTLAVSKMEQSDDAVLAMNDVLDGVSGENIVKLSSEEVSGALAGLGEADSILTEAASFASDAQTGFSGEVDKDAAEKVAASISARQSMVSSGAGVLKDASAALSAVALAREGWQQLLAADAISREAVSLVSTMTTNNVKASMEKSKEAAEAFSAADAKFAKAQEAYPVADFDSYREYLAKRVEAEQYAVASDEAYLARDKETLAAQNDAYNEADQQAVALAEGFPEDPAELVAKAFDAANEQLLKSYREALESAASGDAFIRDYFGVTSK